MNTIPVFTFYGVTGLMYKFSIEKIAVDFGTFWRQPVFNCAEEEEV